MKSIMSKINCFNNVRLQTNAPEWKINKAIAIISATYTRRMSVVNHLQIIEIYFEGWIQRLKSNFFKFTHTHTNQQKPKIPSNRHIYSQIIGVYGSWKFDTCEKIWFSILYCRETYCLHYCWMRNMIVTINFYDKSSQQYNYNLKVNMQLFQKFINILGSHK